MHVTDRCTFTPNHYDRKTMRKIIGLALWLAALTLPLWWSLLSTDQVVYEDGRANNIKGLISFVALLALLFTGYALVDSAGTKTQDANGNHH